MVKSTRRILLVYPEFFPTYWGMQFALPLVGCKSVMPPLGLLTIAALTPGPREFRLVDLNCGPLADEDIEWADLILFSAMYVQKHALFRAARRCRLPGKFLVFGGPYPTIFPDECEPYCDALVLNEGELSWPRLLADLEAGRPQRRYDAAEKPDITKTPPPRYDLIEPSDYLIIPVQFSRGCPFQCEFCDIIVMFGRKPRTKTPQQFVAELDSVYETGYRGTVFVVDDNFIGNKRRVKELLPPVTTWNREHGRSFAYITEASLNLADDAELMQGMAESDFVSVFIGVESPDEESLKETRKFQNIGGSLAQRIETIQRAGLMVLGGFIVGFDSDTEDIFERQIDFIQRSAIPAAFVGLLGAPPGTPLYERMQREGRLTEDWVDRICEVGSEYATNIVTKLPQRTLLEGTRHLLETIYTPEAIFSRTAEAFSRFPRPGTFRERVACARRSLSVALKQYNGPAASDRGLEVLGTLRGLFGLAVMLIRMPRPFTRELGRFVVAMLWRCPEFLPRALSDIVVGYHCYRFTFGQASPGIEQSLAHLSTPQAMPASRPAAAPAPAAAGVEGESIRVTAQPAQP